MADAVFRGYDQKALDFEYNNRAKVSDAQDFKDAQAHHSAQARAKLEARCDVAYGPSPAETVDVYPAPGSAPAPVHVFFHGGYWKQNHKDEFAFLAPPLVAAGAAVVVVEYALVPTVDIGELVRQCRAALAWVRHEAAGFGGDPGRIHISGHSAGGHITATMMATDWPAFAPGLPRDLVKTGCAISGIYDLEPVRLSYMNGELGFTPDSVAGNSPMLMAPVGGGELLLAVGGLEGPEFIRQSEELAAAWGARGMDVTCRVMDGHHHFSIINQLIDPASELSAAVRAQMGLG